MCINPCTHTHTHRHIHVLQSLPKACSKPESNQHCSGKDGHRSPAERGGEVLPPSLLPHPRENLVLYKSSKDKLPSEDDELGDIPLKELGHSLRHFPEEELHQFVAEEQEHTDALEGDSITEHLAPNLQKGFGHGIRVLFPEDLLKVAIVVVYYRVHLICDTLQLFCNVDIDGILVYPCSLLSCCFFS